MYYSNDREERKKIFEDTMLHCNKNIKLKEAIEASVKNQKIILESDQEGIKSVQHEYEKDVKVIVSKKRSYEAASGYKGKRVCVHNFASATNPGGGVTKGSNAQEECLCRCSTLYPCINEQSAKKAFHDNHRNMLHNGELTALYNDDCIYTPDVVVFKSDEKVPKMLPESEWFSVDVITCAAPNLRLKPNNEMNPGTAKAVMINDNDLKELHVKRANRILDIAKANGAEVVILGAFGCGAFQNPPKVVAEAIFDAVKSHIRDFEAIEFAVYCSPRDSQNYDAFVSRTADEVC